MQLLVRATPLGFGLLIGVAATAHAQYADYPGTPSYNSSSPYNYPGYQGSLSQSPYYYYYPGYRSSYNYPTYSYYQGWAYPAPKAYWDPYVGLRPYSDNAGPKASGHGS